MLDFSGIQKLILKCLIKAYTLLQSVQVVLALPKLQTKNAHPAFVTVIKFVFFFSKKRNKSLFRIVEILFKLWNNKAFRNELAEITNCSTKVGTLWQKLQ